MTTTDEPVTAAAADPEPHFGLRSQASPGSESGAPQRPPFVERMKRRLTGDTLPALDATAAIGLAVATVCAVTTLLLLHPDLILRNTITTGGDMGAHVVAPDYLKNHLLRHFQLSGWTDDWYAGYPIYQFYMVVPAILMVLIGVGLPPLIGVPLLLALIVGASELWDRASNRLVRGLILTATIIGGLLCIDVPENVAFKFVTVIGPLMLPFSVLFLARMSRAPKLVQCLAPLAGLYFVFDSHFEILGGNASSTLAGEFSFALSLNLVILALAFVFRGLETGKYRAATAILIGLAATTHVIPVFYLVVGCVTAFALRPGVRQLGWLATTTSVGAALSAFWLGAFYLHSDYLNDMGWEETTGYAQILFPNTLPYRSVIIGLAIFGAFMSFAVPQRFGMWLTMNMAGAALLVRFIQYGPLNKFWNERVLPFWFLSMALLAAVGLAAAVRAVVAAATGNVGRGRVAQDRFRTITATFVGGGVVLLGMWTLNPGWLWVIPFACAPALAFAVYWMFSFDELPFDTRPVLKFGIAAVAAIGVFVAILMPTRAIRIKDSATSSGPGGALVQEDRFGKDISVPSPSFTKDGTTVQLNGYNLGPFTVASPKNPFSDWASWNYSGYEGKTDYPEFRTLMSTMERLGKTHGCGRAMWEYFEGLGSYGTPMAPMLLPLYTKGCIGSMEGLFFEASMTTPFHFLNQSELSARPSSPKRNMPYQPLNVADGVKHLQMYGVKYYMAKSEEAEAQAAKVPALTEVARVPSQIKTRNSTTKGYDTEKPQPWVIYEVADSDVVTGLDHLPAVMTDVGSGHSDWLDPTVAWYQSPKDWSIPLAADGPKNWPRVACQPAVRTPPPPETKRNFGVPCANSPKSVPVTPAKVSNLQRKDESLSFDVDQVNRPVLVKVSYFPRWKVRGAEGPYRVSPNLMVVVPTSTHVEMYYGSTWIEYFTWFVTLVALAITAFMAWRPEWHFPPGFRFPGDDSPTVVTAPLHPDADVTLPASAGVSESVVSAPPELNWDDDFSVEAPPYEGDGAHGSQPTAHEVSDPDGPAAPRQSVDDDDDSVEMRTVDASPDRTNDVPMGFVDLRERDNDDWTIE